MIRTGIGYDLHRLVAGRRLVLGGVHIEHAQGLEGHSDADVLAHAVIDALLGAAALGGIGRHFPPGDARFKDVSSLDLLRNVTQLLAQGNWRVVNIDATVIAEQPRLDPHLDRIRDNLAQALALDPGSVNVKATTNEGVDAVGESRAIASMAVATVEGGSR